MGNKLLDSKSISRQSKLSETMDACKDDRKTSPKAVMRRSVKLRHQSQSHEAQASVSTC